MKVYGYLKTIFFNNFHIKDFDLRDYHDHLFSDLVKKNVSLRP